MSKANLSPPLVRRLPLTEVPIDLNAVIEQVHLDKEYVILEKDGIPLAVLMDIDEFEDYLELHDPAIQQHIAASNEEYRAGQSRPAIDFFEEVDIEEANPHSEKTR